MFFSRGSLSFFTAALYNEKRGENKNNVIITYDIDKADKAVLCGTTGAKAAAVANREVTQKAVNLMVKLLIIIII